jgi:hypothetical protein
MVPNLAVPNIRLLLPSSPCHGEPIPSDEGEMRYFSDLYTCSYTPTLSALIQSRDRGSSLRSSDPPSLLLVAQPGPFFPTLGAEMQVVQELDTNVTCLISEAATPATVMDALRHHRFAHFACHGTPDSGETIRRRILASWRRVSDAP